MQCLRVIMHTLARFQQNLASRNKGATERDDSKVAETNSNSEAKSPSKEDENHEALGQAATFNRSFGSFDLEENELYR